MPHARYFQGTNVRRLHPTTSTQGLNRPAAGGLPTSPFDVVIGSDREFMAAPGAAALENVTAIRGGHSLAKSMHAHTGENFGFISTLWHFNSRLKGCVLRS